MANFEMYYETAPKGFVEAWKVSWVGALGGYSETVWGSIHRICRTAEDAMLAARELQEANNAAQDAAVEWELKNGATVESLFVMKGDEKHTAKNVCIERCFRPLEDLFEVSSTNEDIVLPSYGLAHAYYNKLTSDGTPANLSTKKV